MRTAATYVEKGGVGKTTTTAHLAVAAVQNHDLDTILIDLAGTQNDLSTQFGIAEEAEAVADERPISAVFSDEWSMIVDVADNIAAEMTIDTGEGPDLIPADPGLAGKDNDLAGEETETRYQRLQQFVDDQLADRYDLALLDLPGKEDNIALSGLYAAEHTIATVRPGAFERRQLDRLSRELSEFATQQGVDTRLSMVIPTMVDRTTGLSETFQRELEASYPDLLAPEAVAESQDIPNHQTQGQTLFASDYEDLYGTGQRARDAFEADCAALVEQVVVQP